MTTIVSAYAPVLEALRLPVGCGRLMRDEIHGILDYGPLEVWYFSFPPALIPLGYRAADDPNELFGYWHHWFDFEGRRPSFVWADQERRTELAEIGRSFEQFAVRLAIRAAELAGDDEATLVRILRECGLDGPLLAETLEYYREWGDNFPGYAEHSAFRDDPPLECFEGDARGYRGDFPHPGMPVEHLWNCSGIEVPDDLLAGFRDERDLPPWLQGYPRPDIDRVFNGFLEQGRLREAWMCLNSAGWEGDAAVGAIRRLAERAQDSRFDILAQAWAEVHRDKDGLV